MHSAALTHDNQILTWGVNDEGTLGRDTKDKTKKTPIDAASDTDGDETEDDEMEFNLKEASPLPVDPSHFPRGTIFTHLVATDSATFVLTREGLVYGWGTFRGNNGRIGFSPKIDIQSTPVLVPGLQNVTKLAAGAQHILALTSDGVHQTSSSDDLPWLTPGKCALRDIIDTGAGLYHSFAIQKNGKVYGWGSNNFGQTGVFDGAGQSGAMVLYLTEVPSFRKRVIEKDVKITSVFGGKNHSLALTNQGKCLTWGRIDNKDLGFATAEIPPSDIIHDAYGKPRILKAPKSISLRDIAFTTAGTDHSFGITNDGKTYSWGFNDQHQAGHDADEDDGDDKGEIEEPTLLDSKYVKGKRLVLTAAGGQFSIVAGLSDSN
ncbi:Protein pim1 [Talaromyces islandicus]|uniref:Protein pim1 n=1 Tax=Talaromyces islandicus TaxID=28573 RepID=A0A0U1LJC6_TALIS|nr:Protein pim1 [Talaromyces islandicus]